jgi:hypothetical protein
MYERYSKYFPPGNYEKNKNFRVLWALATSMYFTWRPAMNVDEFMEIPPKGRRLTLPKITNYFQETGKASKFIKLRLDRLEKLLNNDIDNGIVNLSGAPYVAVRLIQVEKKKLKTRIFELEQENAYLKRQLNETI